MTEENSENNNVLKLTKIWTDVKTDFNQFTLFEKSQISDEIILFKTFINDYLKQAGTICYIDQRDKNMMTK